MLRTFLSLEPDDSGREALSAWQRQHLRSRRGPRPIDPDQLHLTLRFFGNLRQTQVGEISRQLAGLEPALASTRVTGFGGFPTAKRATVLVAKILDSDGSLMALEAELTVRLEQLDLPPPNRQFVAHVTLGRLPKAADISSYMVDPSRIAPFRWKRLALVHSELSPQGAEHHELQSWPVTQTPEREP